MKQFIYLAGLMLFMPGIKLIKMNKIDIIYLTEINQAVDIKKLIQPIKETYNCEVKIIPTEIGDLEFAYDSSRKQYFAPKILEKLKSMALLDKFPNFRLVAIVDKDIYDYGLNFIFGEAHEKYCVVSIWRFKPCTKINTPQEEKLLLDRTVKTIIHELGHTIGLGHCSNRTCVMFFSNWLSDTDYKSHNFCKICKPR